jgi:hypothetical protein
MYIGEHLSKERNQHSTINRRLAQSKIPKIANSKLSMTKKVAAAAATTSQAQAFNLSPQRTNFNVNNVKTNIINNTETHQLNNSALNSSFLGNELNNNNDSTKTQITYKYLSTIAGDIFILACILVVFLSDVVNLINDSSTWTMDSPMISNSDYKSTSPYEDTFGFPTLLYIYKYNYIILTIVVVVSIKLIFKRLTLYFNSI